MIFLPITAYAERFCLIADIHNGSGTRKLTKENITYPKWGNRYFKEALKRAKANSVDACIVLGDNTNKGKKKEAKKLAKTAQKSGVKVIWVKGNHDSNKSQKYLYEKTNYFVDFSDVRVIVLDSNFTNITGNGGVSPANQEFYQEALNTDKKIILAMHHPPVDKRTHEWNHQYDWIGDKPEYILSGHLHTGFKEGKIWSLKALTLKKNLKMEYIEL